MLSTRSKLLKDAIAEALKAKQGEIQWQSDEAAPWNVADQALGGDVQVGAARVVIDEPAAILEKIEPVLAQLSQVRVETERAMHTISLLDRDLSDARVNVRQAELDSGRAVLEKVDAVGACR